MKKIHLFVDFLAAFTSLFIIAHLLGLFFMDSVALYCIILSLLFAVEYLPDIVKPNLKPIQKTFSVVCMLGGIVPHIYLFLNVARIRVMYGVIFTTGDVVFGTIAVLAVLAWGKRRFGWALPIIAIVFSLHVLLGHFLPMDMMGHRYFSYGRYISFLFSEGGMYGSLMAIAVRVIFLYMLFGAFLKASGVGEYLITLSSVLAGKYRGGPAKVTIVASALLGTISGSAVANVATTGHMTIPLMNKTGYRIESAAAIEAVASTGGQILPPIMGAGAFVMAEFLGVSYATVAMAAAIPAFLYYVAVFLQVDLTAVKMGLKGAEPASWPEKKSVLKKLYMLLPLVVLVYLLIVARFTVTRAGLFACLSVVLISWVSKEFRMGFRKIYAALADGAKESVGIVAVMMVAGIIVGAMTCTGLAPRLSSLVVSAAGGNMTITALLTATICILLGLGLPTTAAYVITVAVALPALIRTGVEPLAAHMFVFYYAVLANITPPVAPAVFTAANIAKIAPGKVLTESVKLALLAYLMPLFFLNDTSLLAQGYLIETTQALFTALFGCAILAVIIQGVTFKGNHVSIFVRLVWTASALALLEPSMDTDIYGLVLFGAGLLLHLFTNRLKGGTPSQCQ